MTNADRKAWQTLRARVAEWSHPGWREVLHRMEQLPVGATFEAVTVSLPQQRSTHPVIREAMRYGVVDVVARTRIGRSPRNVYRIAA